ncbi:MAG: tyrosinase family protein, partial [Candidatus Nitrosopolaris sp.]
WDWNHDPSNLPDGTGGTVNLFDSNFMGNANGEVGEPLLSGGIYAPHAVLYRDDNILRLNRPTNDPSTWSYDSPHYNPADPPKMLSRQKQSGDPPVGVAGSGWPHDEELVNAPDWETFNHLMQGAELPPHTIPTDAHGAAHEYIGGAGGELSDPHISFRDPFVFLLHSNVDRLWAKWQRDPAHPERLDPAQVYGTDPALGGDTTGSGDVEGEAQGLDNPTWGILSPLEPWASFDAQTNLTGVVVDLWPINPWFTAPEIKNSKDPSVVRPPVYADP